VGVVLKGRVGITRIISENLCGRKPLNPFPRNSIGCLESHQTTHFWQAYVGEAGSLRAQLLGHSLWHARSVEDSVRRRIEGPYFCGSNRETAALTKAAQSGPAGSAGDGQGGRAEGVMDVAGRKAEEYHSENGACDDAPDKGPGAIGWGPLAAEKLDPDPCPSPGPILRLFLSILSGARLVLGA
jgi:hypothetical protein